MLSFFMYPYPDEILYSLICRYHLHSGNLARNKTLQELFSSCGSISIELPRNLDNISESIGHNYYSSTHFIMNNTLFPLYYPFLTLEKRETLIQAMKEGNVLPNTLVGLTKNKINVHSTLRYCPICGKEDVNKYGEAYFHRIHQVHGVFTCPSHMCILEDYPIAINERVRNKLISFNYDNISNTNSNTLHHGIYNQLVKISESAQFVLNNDLSNYNLDIVLDKYLYELKERGLLLSNGQIDRIRLSNEFGGFHGHELLSKVNANLNGRQNWLQNINFNKKTTVTLQPIRHILIILFLTGDIASFFAEIPKKRIDELYNFGPRSSREKDMSFKDYFGIGPWKCLNPVSSHYNDMVVYEYKMIFNNKKKTYSALFTCGCGYSYYIQVANWVISSYTKKKVKTYGDIWDSKLIEYISYQGIANINKLAKLMGCDKDSIVTQSKRLGLIECISIPKCCDAIANREESKLQVQLIEKHRETIMQCIRENPDFKRTDIRKLCNCVYEYVYLNDHIWFEENMPKPTPRAIRNKSLKTTRNWVEVDVEIYDLLKNAYIKLVNLDKPARISMVRISEMIGKRHLIKENLYRLPKSKEYLESIIENREQYLLRKVDIIYKRLNIEDKKVNKWKLISIAGIGYNVSSKVYDRIEHLTNN